MDIEYHFYITYIIALRAGFDRNTACKIAYSCQYTDDNNYIYSINEGKPDAYQNYISQTFNILKPKNELIRIHPVFHFFPGSGDEILNHTAPRRDGKFHLLNTIPGSKNAEDLMNAALKSGNPHRIGIASHTFADTYAHQNFTGTKDEFNAMRGFLERLIPNIGHADAQHNPDLPALKWEDNRLSSGHKKIDNKVRFLSASAHIFKLFSLHLKPEYPKKSLERKADNLSSEISQAIGPYDKTNSKQSVRINRYKKLIGDGLVEDYDKNSWFRSAVHRRRDTVTDPVTDQRSYKTYYVWKENYKSSDWFIFQEAVKKQQEKALEILEPQFEQMEIAKAEIW